MIAVAKYGGSSAKNGKQTRNHVQKHSKNIWSSNPKNTQHLAFKNW